MLLSMHWYPASLLAGVKCFAHGTFVRQKLADERESLIWIVKNTIPELEHVIKWIQTINQTQMCLFNILASKGEE